MHGLNVEYRCRRRKPLARDLADHIYRRALYGKIVVVTDKPLGTLSSVKKQWNRLIRMAHVERARTLKAERIRELTSQIAYMRSVCFSAKMPEDTLEANVTFVTAEAMARIAPICQTLYITYTFPKIQLHLMTSWMPRYGLVVVYGQE